MRSVNTLPLKALLVLVLALVQRLELLPQIHRLQREFQREIQSLCSKSSWAFYGKICQLSAIHMWDVRP